MKRISWKLPVYPITDFKFYDIDNKTKNSQPNLEPNLEGDLPIDNSYFLGELKISEDEYKKLLCYHISGGKYIVISYNRNTEIIFNDIITTYTKEEIKLKNEQIENSPVKVINSDGTVGASNE